MQVDAIYEDGRLTFVEPLRLVRRRFQVRVELPDDVVPAAPAAAGTGAEQPGPRSAEGAAWLARLETLRNEALAGDAAAPRPEA
jgi:hypothetical protein